MLHPDVMTICALRVSNLQRYNWRAHRLPFHRGRKGNKTFSLLRTFNHQKARKPQKSTTLVAQTCIPFLLLF